MYARILLASDPAAAPDQAALSAEPGYAGHAYAMQPDGPGCALITFFDTEDQASSRNAAPSAGSGSAAGFDEVYEVSWMEPGSAQNESPATIQLVFFDGPRDPAQLAADSRLSEAIKPAMTDVVGLVAHYALNRRDGGWVAMTLATSFDALLRAAETATSVSVEPATTHPTRPDRVLDYALSLSHLPLPATSSRTA
ncbi:MAG: hypothetical protein ABWZ26_01535 [Candidatus Nanopelagicales bacterium]